MKTQDLSKEEMKEVNGGMSVIPPKPVGPFGPEEQVQTGPGTVFSQDTSGMDYATATDQAGGPQTEI